MFLIGFFLLRSTTLAWLGLILFSATVVFALVTLPTELNASARALTMLRETGLVLNEDEAHGARAVLNAAALTYVAALAQAIMTMLYYIFLLTGSGRRR
jgi:Zn-dependent membrane protease YugP